VYIRTTSLSTPSSSVNASESPLPGKLHSVPRPGSVILASGAGGGNNPGSLKAGGGGNASFAAANTGGAVLMLQRAIPTPETMAVARPAMNFRRFRSVTGANRTTGYHEIAVAHDRGGVSVSLLFITV
jgi:hypothetical protein